MAKSNFTFKDRGVGYELIHYLRNADTGRFLKCLELVNFPRLPPELETQHTREERLLRNGADQIITGRFHKKRREFFTGLRSTGFPQLRSGNDVDKSEVLFLFAEDFSKMAVFHFTGWRCFPSERQAFFAEFVIHLRTIGFKF